MNCPKNCSEGHFADLIEQQGSTMPAQPKPSSYEFWRIANCQGRDRRGCSRARWAWFGDVVVCARAIPMPSAWAARCSGSSIPHAGHGTIDSAVSGGRATRYRATGARFYPTRQPFLGTRAQAIHGRAVTLDRLGATISTRRKISCTGRTGDNW